MALKKEKKQPEKEAVAEEKKAAAPKRPFYDLSRGVHRILPIVILTLAILLGTFLILDLFDKNTTPAAALIRFLKGVFSHMVYALPVLLTIIAIRWRNDVTRERAISRLVYFFLFVVFVEAIIWCFMGPKPESDGSIVFRPGDYYRSGKDFSGAGFLGGFVGWLLNYLAPYIGVPLFSAALLCLYLFHFHNLTPARIAEMRRARREKAEGTDTGVSVATNASDAVIAESIPAETTETSEPAPAEEKKLTRKEKRELRRKEKEEKKNPVFDDGYYPESNQEESFDEIRRKMEKEAAEIGRSRSGEAPVETHSATPEMQTVPFVEIPAEEEQSYFSAGDTAQISQSPASASAAPAAQSADAMFSTFNPLADSAVINTTSTVLRPLGTPGETRREAVRPVTREREEYTRVPGGVRGEGESVGTFRIHPTHNDLRANKAAAVAAAEAARRAAEETPAPTSEPEAKRESTVGSPLSDFEMVTRRPAPEGIPQNTLPYVHPATMASTQPQPPTPSPIPPQSQGYPYAPYPPMPNGYPAGYPAQPYAPYPGYPYPAMSGQAYPAQPVTQPTPETSSIPVTRHEEVFDESPVVATSHVVEHGASEPTTPTPAQTYTEPASKPQIKITQPEAPQKRATPTYDRYAFPPVSLLNRAVPITNLNSQSEIEDTSGRLVAEFRKFKYNVEVREVTVGPRITRYSISPPDGVRINTLIGLANDIALGLAVKSIRIDPVPNTPYLGVEIPNRTPSTVHLSSLIDTENFRNSKTVTTIPIGASVTGQPVFADIAKMPHVLIAGATGMGKSVFMNSLLLSLLYRAKPNEVKLILVDPKRVELSMYNGIPHLLIPPVVEPQKAAGALIWAVGEMERRYHLMETVGMRSIEGYNDVVRNDPSKGEVQPKIIIVIDELNDLMMQARDAVEPAIMSIAQKARAAGIHLILGTQRPSVDVITGVIKANIPSRIAFHVSSGTDSRTILDFYGAEKLLNNGDMLSAIAGAEAIRVQGAFVSDSEVLAVTTFLKQNAGPAVYDEIVSAQIESETEKYKNSGKRQSERDTEDEDIDGSIFEDSKFMAACNVALESGKISTSLLQRRCSIGFGKAAKYIDIMQSMGIVSELDGQKPREVLMTRDQFMEMVSRESYSGD